MLLNSTPLNSAPLNSLHFWSAAVEPQPVVAGTAYQWELRLLVDGIDRTAALTDVPNTDRERAAAGLCDFVLCLVSGAYDPRHWRGKSVVLDYISTSQGVTTTRRRFTGWIESPSWDSVNRLLTCQCSDRLQQRIESMPIAEIDALTSGAVWSADVFSLVEGRSRWEYFTERMSTLAASVNADAGGALTLTPWFAGAVAFDFGPGTTVFGTASVEYVELGQLTNKIEIEVSLRFSRLRQKNNVYFWQHPETSMLTGMPGFCAYRPRSSELPDIQMITQATESSGQQLVAASWYVLPPTNPDPCGTGAPWINRYTELLLGGTWAGGRRWVQSVTETYPMTVEAPASIADAGPVLSRVSLSFEIEAEQADAWESDPIDGGDTGHIDVRDEPRRQMALGCVLRQAKTAILKAHNQTLVSWDEPTSMVMDVDLGTTLRLNDAGIRATGRCCRIVDRFDLGAGLAVTTLTIAVMRGGGDIDDALTIPPGSVEEQDGSGGGGLIASMPTQLDDGGEYVDSRDGFAGNYSTGGSFPRRFQLTAAEIPAAQRDEAKVTIPATYRVAIPDDELEM